jgi:hypothetical protein
MKMRAIEQIKIELREARNSGDTNRKNQLLDELIIAENPDEMLKEEVYQRIGRKRWGYLIGFNQYHSNHLGLTLEFFRTESGVADYRFRPSTTKERAEIASDYVEDNI